MPSPRIIFIELKAYIAYLTLFLITSTVIIVDANAKSIIICTSPEASPVFTTLLFVIALPLAAPLFDEAAAGGATGCTGFATNSQLPTKCKSAPFTVADSGFQPLNIHLPPATSIYL